MRKVVYTNLLLCLLVSPPIPPLPRELGPVPSSSCTKLAEFPRIHEVTAHLFSFFLMFIYFWETDRIWAGEGQRERGRHRTWSRLQALSCQHRAQGRARTHMLWDHDLSQSWTLNRLSHPAAPGASGFFRLELCTESAYKVTYMATGKPQSLTGYWPEPSVPCYAGPSIGLFKYGILLLQNEDWQRKKRWERKSERERGKEEKQRNGEKGIAKG